MMNKSGITATEQKRWEELNTIRSMPISIAEKRAMKAKLTNLPVVELDSKKRYKWFLKRVIRRWRHQFRSHGIWQRSLQDIEVRGGTSIVNVFVFIKRTVLSNILLFLIVFGFVIFPYILGKKTVSLAADKTCPANYTAEDTDNFTVTNQSMSLDQLSDCCVTDYYQKNKQGTNLDFWKGFSGTISGWELDKIDFTFSPMTYGFYSFYEFDLAGFSYSFRQAYILVVSFLSRSESAFRRYFPKGPAKPLQCLVSMVGEIGVGIKEMTLTKEGEFYKFSNLVFAGWDHYTKDEAGASFKKKILKNEMKIALKTEKLKVKIISKRQQFRLFLKRGLAHVVVVFTMFLIGGIIYGVADYSIKQSCAHSGGCNKKQNVGRRMMVKLLPPIVIAVLNVIFPIFLKRIIRKLERYSQEVHTALTLIRCLIVRVLAIGFAAVKYYAEEYCEKSPGACTVCLKEEISGKLLAKDYCWESVFGVHIYLIILVDFVMKVFIVFVIGYGKLLLGKLTKIRTLQEVTKFNIIRHSLDIIYIQCLSWFFYFAPFLPFFVTIYCIIVGYMKKFNLMVLSQSVPDTFRAARTTTLFVMTKLLAFVVATLTIGFVLTSLEPSRSCGPFRGLSVPWDVVSKGQYPLVERITATIGSPGVAIPVVAVLATLSYYYYNTSLSHKRMVDTLRHMLILEGHDKQYLFERLSTLRREAAAIVENETKNQRILLGVSPAKVESQPRRAGKQYTELKRAFKILALFPRRFPFPPSLRQNCSPTTLC